MSYKVIVKGCHDGELPYRPQNVTVLDGNGDKVSGLSSISFTASVEGIPELKLTSWIGDFELEIEDAYVDKKGIYPAKFEDVVDGVCELQKQGLDNEEIKKRLRDALILTNLSGLGAETCVIGLTSAIKEFSKNETADQKELNRRIKDAVVQVLEEEKLLGGILKKLT